MHLYALRYKSQDGYSVRLFVTQMSASARVIEGIVHLYLEETISKLSRKTV